MIVTKVADLKKNKELGDDSYTDNKGLWALLCQELQLPNQKSNRKRLHNAYAFHKVCTYQACFLASIVLCRGELRINELLLLFLDETFPKNTEMC